MEELWLPLRIEHRATFVRARSPADRTEPVDGFQGTLRMAEKLLVNSFPRHIPIHCLDAKELLINNPAPISIRATKRFLPLPGLSRSVGAEAQAEAAPIFKRQVEVGP